MKTGFSTSGLLIAALAMTGCGQASTDPRALPPLVRTAVLEAGGGGSQEYTGIVAARVQSDLGFRVGGKVVERFVQAGQVVRRGQPLMLIDPNDLALASQAAQGAVSAARARSIQADADERRYREMVAAGAVSQSAYDQAKAAADAARAQLSSAQAQAGIARNATGYGVLFADADGTVVETLAEPGQVVMPGQVVVRIARAGPREALIQLPETVRPALGSPAQARTFSGAVGGAQLRLLSDAADPASRTFEARYVLDGAPSSAPLGSTVTIALPTQNATAGATVPLGAIHDFGRGPGVWVVRAGSPATVDWRPVRIASVAEETATVTEGLKFGERFVAVGAHKLHKGQAVRVEGTAGRPAR